MKYTLIIFFLFLSQLTSYSQTITKGKLIDANTHEPIRYASIETTKGASTFSNYEGVFEIPWYPSDTIMIQSLGYEDTTLVQIPMIIQMKALDYQIKEVVVEAKKGEEEKIFAGVKKPKGIRIVTVQELYIQHGIHIPYIADSLVLHDISIFNTFSDTPKKFRDAPILLRIYNVDSLGYPKDDLLQEEKLISFAKKGKNTFNLGMYNIQMPKGGIVIALEWVETKALFLTRGLKNTKTPRLAPTIKTYKAKKAEQMPYRWLSYQPKERKWFYLYDYWLSQGLDHKDLRLTVPAIGANFIKM